MGDKWIIKNVGKFTMVIYEVTGGVVVTAGPWSRPDYKEVIGMGMATVTAGS